MNEKIITLDFEASGLATDSYPIEVGIVLEDGSAWCSLIEPPPHWTHWCPKAESIHRISQEQLTQHGKPIQEVVLTLNEKLKGKTVYSDCWVLDQPWLIKLYNEVRLSPSFQLRDIIHIMKEEQFLEWRETRNAVLQELKIERHRATNDARVLQEAYHQTHT